MTSSGHGGHAGLADAEAFCAREGIRLTPLRRQVLALLYAHSGPVGAYELLGELRDALGKAEAPTVYRALDFLLEHRLAHRIESLNAFLACPHPGEGHIGQFLICDACKSATELTDRSIDHAISSAASKAGFQVHRQTVEVIGRCDACKRQADA